MPKPKKNPHAVALGRLGGLKGGHARAAVLTTEEMQEIARKGGLVGGHARMASLTPKKRSALAAKGAAARWAKRDD
jgi:hypothetical protein